MEKKKPAAKPAAQPAAKPAEKKPAKPVAKKTEVKPAAKPDEKKPVKAAKPSGKWIIEQKGQGEYLSKLLASNGEVMLTSEIYSGEGSAVSGVSTIIKGVETGSFTVYENKNGTFYYKLKSAQNRLLCAGEIYKDRGRCLAAIESVKRIAGSAELSDGVFKGSEYVKYKPEKITKKSLAEATAGKWKIEVAKNGKYYATLYACNGQVMLSTEEVSSKASALSGIENVKKNCAAGNFVIDQDKFGKFYYKLRNAQKSVVCIGESYAKLESCIKALETVRRLAEISPLADK